LLPACGEGRGGVAFPNRVANPPTIRTRTRRTRRSGTRERIYDIIRRRASGTAPQCGPAAEKGMSVLGRFGTVVLCVLGGLLTIGLLAGCGKGAVAVVNGRKITEEEFHKRLETMEGGRMLYDMIAREILTEEAAKAGIQVSAKQVDEEVAKLAGEFASREEFVSYLQRRGQTPEQFRDERAFAIMLEGLATRDVTVTDEDVEEHFAANREQYDRPAQYRVSEIVVETQEAATELRRQLNDARASFDALARELSTAPTSAAGGAVGSRPLNAYPDEWQSVLRGMKVGDSSEPLETARGWEIIKLLELSPRRAASLDDPGTREAVYQMVRMQRAKPPHELLRDAIHDGKHRVVVRWPQYKELAKQFAPPPDIPALGPTEPPPEPSAESPDEGKVLIDVPEEPPHRQPGPAAPPAGASPGRTPKLAPITK